MKVEIKSVFLSLRWDNSIVDVVVMVLEISSKKEKEERLLKSPRMNMREKVGMRSI